MMQEIKNLLSAIKPEAVLPLTLQKIENINQVDENKHPLLMLACRLGNATVVETLLKHLDHR